MTDMGLVIVGAAGRMGQTLIRTIHAMQGVRVAAALERAGSAAVGKDVRLLTEGEGTEVDKTVIERLVDPLTHMIRNAVDHGIEDLVLVGEVVVDGHRVATDLAGQPTEGEGIEPVAVDERDRSVDDLGSGEPDASTTRLLLVLPGCCHRRHLAPSGPLLTNLQRRCSAVDQYLHRRFQ